jgi:hypothetical protein
MEISSSTSQVANNVQVALAKQSLDAMKVQGAQLTKMIASAGSVNSASQGQYVDARA